MFRSWANSVKFAEVRNTETIVISQRAQKRLFRRYKDMIVRKPAKVVVVALAQELAGFLWEAFQSSSVQTARTMSVAICPKVLQNVTDN